EEDLAQLLHGSGLHTQRRCDRCGGLAGAQQVTRVQRLDRPARYSPGDAPRLLLSLLRERRIELPLDSAFAIPGRLAVTDEDQPRGGWSNRSRHGAIDGCCADQGGGAGALRHCARRSRGISPWLRWREI